MGRLSETYDFAVSAGEDPVVEFPVPLDGRTFCGDLDIRIDANGEWRYNAEPIQRKEMVCLFASMLMKDASGRHWLVTPTEMGRIEVADAPFVAVEMLACGRGREQTLSFRTNTDHILTLGPQTPLVMHKSPATGNIAPYLNDENGLEVKLTRAVYYELVEYGHIEHRNGTDVFGVWSGGAFFPMGKIQDTDA